VQLSYDSHNYELLNLNIRTLDKKHGQLKAVVQSIVEQSMAWLDPVKEKDGVERWLELIDTLRTVTEGKVGFVLLIQFLVFAYFKTIPMFHSRSSWKLPEPV
jgi:hypothetical protein